jgi:hypothetical protein
MVEGKSRKEARTSFLKKRSKKLLVVWASAFPGNAQPRSQKFFASFFQKRTASLAARLPFKRGFSIFKAEL